MRVIIAEKPSVANALASALPGARERGEGWVRVGDDTVTWAYGHLVEPALPEEYEDHDWKRWRMDSLPIIPDQWKWVVSPRREARKQYAIVSHLLRRRDVDTIVNACDPDREGEAIFRRIIRQAGVDKPCMRLWVASLEEDAIRDAFARMHAETMYDGLAGAADIRAKADWLIGMNATRAYTVAYGQRITVGRVQTPTLAMVAERDRRIEAHTPEPFWTVILDMGGWTLTSGRYDDPDKAQHAADVAAQGVTVTDVRRHTVHDRPPALYDLTGLQKDMNRMHHVSAARTLTALQHLYELKLTTYPRTDSRYITRDDQATLDRLTHGDQTVTGFIDPDDRPAQPRTQLTVNDDKVSGHTAILPTGRADAASLDKLTDDERKVLTRIIRRMWEAVGDDHVHDTTKVTATTTDPEVTFTGRSDLTVTPGWTSIEHNHNHDGDTDKADDDADGARRSVIPLNLDAGVTLTPVAGPVVKRGESKPPKAYTDGTLLAAMEHASSRIDERDLKHAMDDDTSHSGGLGTPATRADTIERLIHADYLTRDHGSIRSTPQGRMVADTVARRLTSVELTAGMEQLLADVEHGRTGREGVMRRFEQYTRGIVDDVREHAPEHADSSTETVGVCPRCGEPVIRTAKTWQCSSNTSERMKDGTWKRTGGCGWKMYATTCGVTLTDQQAERLLNHETIHLTGLTSRKGWRFEADATIDPDGDNGITLTNRKGTNQ